MKELKIKLGKAMEASKAEELTKEHAKYYPGSTVAAKEHEEAVAALNEALTPIDEIIKQEEGRARQRCIYAYEIVDAIDGIDQKIGIPKAHMKGVWISVDINAQTFPNSYKYTPESTQFTAEHNGKEWVLTSIWRGACRRPSNTILVHLTEEAQQAVIRSFEEWKRP